MAENHSDGDAVLKSLLITVVLGLLKIIILHNSLNIIYNFFNF